MPRCSTAGMNSMQRCSTTAMTWMFQGKAKRLMVPGTKGTRKELVDGLDASDMDSTDGVMRSPRKDKVRRRRSRGTGFIQRTDSG